jgi:hypothetical protein
MGSKKKILELIFGKIFDYDRGISSVEGIYHQIGN